MPESVKKMIPDVLKVLAQLKIEQQDKRFEVAIRIPESILTGFMAPVTVAVAEARGAARNMASMNNLKQIGIATHNFHENYGRFPVGEFPGDDGLIKYKDGKPALKLARLLAAVSSGKVRSMTSSNWTSRGTAPTNLGTAG